MSEVDTANVLQLLRNVNCPGFDGNIVTLGFVKDIYVNGAHVSIKFAPNTRNQEKVETMERDIRSVIGDIGAFEKIIIDRYQPFEVEGNGGPQRLNPLQAELLEEGHPAESDILQTTLGRADIAPDAGYTEDGPVPLQGPKLEVYDGPVPVLQWEIDPADRSAEGGEDSIVIDRWDIGVWWQVHPRGYVYVSMQAIHEDNKEHGGAARAHPVGRSEAVNLVYDTEKKVVVAIYGTVPDFRPFVEAFRLAYIEGPTSR
jgi:metal-sulfur cluster biosynthetic enzyme